MAPTIGDNTQMDRFEIERPLIKFEDEPMPEDLATFVNALTNAKNEVEKKEIVLAEYERLFEKDEPTANGYVTQEDINNAKISLATARSKKARETRERHTTIFWSVAFTCWSVFALWLAWHNNII